MYRNIFSIFRDANKNGLFVPRKDFAYSLRNYKKTFGLRPLCYVRTFRFSRITNENRNNSIKIGVLVLPVAYKESCQTAGFLVWKGSVLRSENADCRAEPQISIAVHIYTLWVAAGGYGDELGHLVILINAIDNLVALLGS